VVDPGHGGSDPGAVVPDPERPGELIREKEVVVPYALALREVLMGKGYGVRLTRSEDVAVGLSERAKVANGVGALCLVSLHANAASAVARNGAWVIYDDASREENGRALAEAVFAALIQVPEIADITPQIEVFPDGSPHVGGRQLTVLSKATMPAILVELGFMTNGEDLSQLLNPSTRGAVAEAIATGIINWHRGRRIPS
jgi:N-acetylmuramoyl-L-alanine amidase